MSITILGDDLFARDSRGNLKTRIATAFVPQRVVVTLPGIHAAQKRAFVESLNRGRAAVHQPEMTPDEEMAVWDQSVDLILDRDTILIRPDPMNLALAVEADEMLQELVSKRRIKFLHVSDARVKEVIRARGEYWRIAPVPWSPDDITRAIQDARIRLKQPATYYYNRMSGTKFLTYQEFSKVGALDDAALATQMHEIALYCAQRNRLGHPEVSFFRADASFETELAACDWLHTPAKAVREAYEALREKLCRAVDPDLHADDIENAHWRRQMILALLGDRDQAVSDEVLQGLSPEFFLQIEWLPGGRIEDGELIFDTIFDEDEKGLGDAGQHRLSDLNARGFIFNFIRELGDIEYVNVGRISRSLSDRPTSTGRRDVYIAEIKHAGSPHPVVRILRIQKWGIRERLEENKDLLRAIMESEEYTEYILDRRLGCRQLGMNLPRRIVTRRLAERYNGPRLDFRGQTLWATYIERDYVEGIATNRIPPTRFGNPEYAVRFARLLGAAAAANLIVGRADMSGRSLFDDGDEVLIEDAEGMPSEIAVTDPSGTFADFERPMAHAAPDYAWPVNRRLESVPCPVDFAEAYVSAFTQRFLAIQQDYLRRRRAFDGLFKYHKNEPASFAWRWVRLLSRLSQTDGVALSRAIRAAIGVPSLP